MKKISLVVFTIIIFMNLSITNTKANSDNTAPIKVGILLYDESIYFYSLIKNDFLKIEEANKDRVDFIFYDAKNSQELQNSQLDEVINMNVDLIVLNVVDPDSYAILIDKVKKSNIPVIFIGRAPRSFDVLKAYDKAIYIGSDACQSGNIQGQMILNELKNNNITDRNKNNRIDYVLLQGSEKDVATQERSNCVLGALNKGGVQTKEIASEYCNWKRECAKDKVKDLLETYGNDIDIIISNNDEMAIGAILALQEMGYNTGNPEKYIGVVGVDGIEPAIELINQGAMIGTVFQDHEAMANAVYRTGVNLINGKSPIEGTDYKYYNNINQVIIIPYNGYIIRK